MNKILKEKISESVSSVLPITIIVLLLSVTITPMPVGTMVLFLTGAALLIVGMVMALQQGAIVEELSAASQSRSRICRCWPVRCRPFRTMC